MIKKLRKSGSIFVCFHLSWVSEVFRKRSFLAQDYYLFICDHVGSLHILLQQYKILFPELPMFWYPAHNKIATCESRKGHLRGNSVYFFCFIHKGRCREILSNWCTVPELMRGRAQESCHSVLSSLLYSTYHAASHLWTGLSVNLQFLPYFHLPLKLFLLPDMLLSCL